MTTGEALEIVFDLAKDNALEYKDAVGNDQIDEWKKQQEALDIVEDLIVNEYGKDDE